MSERTICHVAVKGTEKSNRSQNYVLQVTWSDGSRYIVYRSFAEIFNLHAELVEAFPIEAGKIDLREKTLPDLEPKGGRCTTAEVMATLALYYDRLIGLERKIITHPALISFLSLTPRDTAAANDARSGRDSGFVSYIQDADEMKDSKATDTTEQIKEISAPRALKTYLAAAAYKGKSKSEVSLNTGDLVDVIYEDSKGWWFVRNDEQEGWAPATYFQPLNKDDEDKGCTCQSGELFVTTKPYTAQQDDELSFPCNASIEIMKKCKDGWWVGSFNNRVGYVPAVYLAEYFNPYLDRKLSGCAVPLEQPQIPVQRSNIITCPQKSEGGTDCLRGKEESTNNLKLQGSAKDDLETDNSSDAGAPVSCPGRTECKDSLSKIEECSAESSGRAETRRVTMRQNSSNIRSLRAFREAMLIEDTSDDGASEENCEEDA